MDIHSGDYAALVRYGPSFVDLRGSWIFTHFLNPLNLWFIQTPMTVLRYKIPSL